MFKRCFIAGMIFIALLGITGMASADVIQQSYEHRLGLGQTSESWDHQIDIPADWAAKGYVFNRRMLAPTGDLEIEREELSRTYYFVKVRLVKGKLGFAKGSLNVTLEGGAPVAATNLQAPEGLSVAGKPLTPSFAWNGNGKYFSISLYNRDTNQTLWERVITGNKTVTLNEIKLKIAGKYTFGVCQSDETSKYSKAANRNFRIDGREEKCRPCNGTGFVICSNCNGTGWVDGAHQMPCYICLQTGKVRCYTCSGSGVVQVPFLVDEGAAAFHACDDENCSLSSAKSSDDQSRLKPCRRCRGTGKETCFKCNGTGWTNSTYPGGAGMERCWVCQGKGYLMCITCGGTGQVE
ncbi:MAG: hypothetical protein HQM10_03985 [Candidatus Riflebacteria bacterium]|nr:hypothetical protein [Candidatus Riflebacteria bacterium]